MVEDPVQLGEQGARPHRALGDLHAEHPLDGEDHAQLVGERGQPVVPVGQHDDLAVVADLEELLGAAVHVADDRLGLQDALAVEDEPQPQHAVRRGVLRADVEHHVRGGQLFRAHSDSHYAFRHIGNAATGCGGDPALGQVKERYAGASPSRTGGVIPETGGEIIMKRAVYDIAALIVRVVVGVIFVAHGWQKWQSGLGATSAGFAQMGVPQPQLAAAFSTIGETVGGALLIIGLLVRPAALMLLIGMVGAIVFGHWGKGIFVQEGGWELPAALGSVALLFLALGGGRLGLDGIIHGSYRRRARQRAAEKASAGRPAPGHREDTLPIHRDEQPRLPGGYPARLPGGAAQPWWVRRHPVRLPGGTTAVRSSGGHPARLPGGHGAGPSGRDPAHRAQAAVRTPVRRPEPGGHAGSRRVDR